MWHLLARLATFATRRCALPVLWITQVEDQKDDQTYEYVEKAFWI